MVFNIFINNGVYRGVSFIQSILMSFCLGILFWLPAWGTIINVPGDYTVIQDAINASANNDTVLVANGTYTENIDFSGKAILLTSENGPENTTIEIQITGSPVVKFESGRGPFVNFIRLYNQR
jgi:hypothetical protein